MNCIRSFVQVLFIILLPGYAFLMAGAIRERSIVVIIPSYNNVRWVEKNLMSVFEQKYENFRVIYIDDCSTDGTYGQVNELVKKHHHENRVSVIHNEMRCGPMANWYKAIHLCDDNDIVVHLDGDDWLAHDQVLAYLNKIYADGQAWFTYGQYKRYPSDEIGNVNKSFPQYVIDSNTFRHYCLLPVSHLRTHYAWLFKLVKLEDFLYDEYFYAMTSDKAMLAPMIEMAANGHFRQIHDVLYIYNNSNPIGEDKVNASLQYLLATHIYAKRPYERISEPVSVEYVDEHDHASLVLICQEKPQIKYLEAMLTNVSFLQQACVLVPGCNSCEDCWPDNVKIVYYEQNELAEKIMECLSAIDSNYVIMSTDVTEISEQFNVSTCIALLKKTHTNIFYGAMGYQAEDRELLVKKRLPCVSQNDPAFAWYSGNKNGSWQTPVMSMTLWSKNLLIDAMSSIHAMNLAELKISLDEWLTHQNKLGLFFSKKMVMDNAQKC